MRLTIQYLDAECVRPNIRRVPLKPQGLDDDETKHLSLSSDGLRFFHPVTLYPHNCQSSSGLLAVLGELDKLQSMKSNDCKSYSVINVDVSLYSMFMHMLYGVGGMQPFLSNVFFLFGIWHAYMYAHTALWDYFRYSFLGDAFFCFRRPPYSGNLNYSKVLCS